MSEKRYIRRKHETQVVSNYLLVSSNISQEKLDSQKQRLYIMLWLELAEALGSGREFYVKFGPITEVEGPHFLLAARQIRLEVEVAPLHEASPIDNPD